MIDRVRISSQGRQHLIVIKRKTGIEQYNVICRYALILSLLEKSIPPKEDLVWANGLEIDWRVFCSGETDLYYDLLALRAIRDHVVISDEMIKDLLEIHLQRGLAYLYANPEQILSDV